MFEVFEHTADLGLRVRGATREELFAEAARGLLSLIIANPEDVRLVESRTLAVEGTEDDYLLFDWLNEILYLFETDRLLLVQFAIEFTSAGLSARCEGEVRDVSRHVMEHEVKAITYHGLKVEGSDQAWQAEVIVDI